MAKISIIVPVYKVEVYLQRCIDSILIQTFKDFELILVDDGSPDNCPKICDEYAKRDKRIHVIHQKNAGLSAARNTGIDWVFSNSNSEWLTFVDSDDWIHPRMLEALLKAAQENKVAISICGYAKSAGDSPLVGSDTFFSEIWNPEDYYVKNTVNATVAWGKLYKRTCFSEIRYPVGKIHEDEFTTYKILFVFDRIAVIREPLYAYFQNPNGIMQSKWTPGRLDGLIAHKEQILYFENNHFEKAKHRAIKALLWGTKEQLEIVIRLNQKKDILYLRRLLREEIHQYKEILALSPWNTSDLYEAAYPKAMYIYWLVRSFLGKIHWIR